MSKRFNSEGVEKIAIEGFPESFNIGNIEDILSSKINITNDSDGLIYTVGVQSVAGIATIYLFANGSAKKIAGVYYILNTDDNLWYPIRVDNVAGVATLYLGDGVTL